MTRLWKSDEELFELAKRDLFTAVVGDVMDQMDLQKQFLPPQIKPLDDEMVVIGRAMPVLEADVFGEAEGSGANPIMRKPFGLVFEAVDSLKPNEVYISAGASPTYALWGGLMSVRCMYLGAAGAIVDGYSRDTREIRSLKFPCFSYGNYAPDQGPRGKVMDYRVPLKIGEAYVRPGDILFGDLDGVCVVPVEAEEEVFTRALEKARGEHMVRKALEAGMSTLEAFNTYGIM